jgi:hypothetical protein
VLTDFTFPQFHVLPQFPLPFYIPDYENLTDLMFSSSQNFLFRAAHMIQPNGTYYQLAAVQLKMICSHHVLY